MLVEWPFAVEKLPSHTATFGVSLYAASRLKRVRIWSM